MQPGQRWIRRLGLAAAVFAIGCSGAKPAGETASPPVVPVAPASSESASASASASAAPASRSVETPPGYVRMYLGTVSEEDTKNDYQFIFFEGDRCSMPYGVPKQVWELLWAYKHGPVPADLRAPYEAWIAKTLGRDGEIVRAEIGSRGDEMPMTLLVRHGDKVERLEGLENVLPAVVLKRIPLFVEIKLLKEIGGWVERDGRGR